MKPLTRKQKVTKPVDNKVAVVTSTSIELLTRFYISLSNYHLGYKPSGATHLPLNLMFSGEMVGVIGG